MHTQVGRIAQDLHRLVSAALDENLDASSQEGLCQGSDNRLAVAIDHYREWAVRGGRLAFEDRTGQPFRVVAPQSHPETTVEPS